MYTYHFISYMKRKLPHKCTEIGRNICLNMVGKHIAEMLLIHFYGYFFFIWTATFFFFIDIEQYHIQWA